MPHIVGVPRVVAALSIYPALSLALGLALASPALAARKPDVSVQPVACGGCGPAGPAVRKVVARAVRSRGLRVTTEIPLAAGTGQYYTWAREVGLKAFVSTELETLGRRRRATFLVWSGHNGGVVGRWTVTARAADLPRVVARGFWPRLGPSFRRAKLPPEWRPVAPGPTQRIDAGLSRDEAIGGYHAGRRRRPLTLQ